MKLPKTLRIAGKKWKVERSEPDNTANGLTCYETRTIYVSPHLTGDDAVDTFLHEVLHACLGHEVDLYLPKKRDELLVLLLTPRLLEVLRQVGSWR